MKIRLPNEAPFVLVFLISSPYFGEFLKARSFHLNLNAGIKFQDIHLSMVEHMTRTSRFQESLMLYNFPVRPAKIISKISYQKAHRSNIMSTEFSDVDIGD